MSYNPLNFLVLSEEEMIQVGVTDMSKCVKVIEEVFQLLGQGDYLMGGPEENSHGCMLWFPKEKRTENMPVAGFDRRFMSMIAYLGGRFNVCGNKWYGSNVANKEKGLPRSILQITLNDVDTGAPLCFCSGNLVSSMRTGAVPGVATKYLQSKDASVVGIVGAGVISHACTLAIAETLAHKGEIKVYDLFPEKAASFCDELRQLLPGIKLTAVSTLEECIRGSDIISVATSGAAPAKIDGQWLKEGAVVELTGCADISAETYMDCRIVFDNWNMHHEWLTEGLTRPEGLDSLDSWAGSAMALKLYYAGKKSVEEMPSLGDIILGKTVGRTNDKEKIIFIAGGMPVEDVAWAKECYDCACQLGLGTVNKVWDSPHWA